MGYGFVPNIELPQLAGCELAFSEENGGWVIQVNDQMETSIKDIFAAGEITGIGGAFKSITEGETAASSILNRFEKLNDERYSSQLKKLTKQRFLHLKFGKLFTNSFSFGF